MQKRYQNIFIDLDDTIYDFAAASRESFEEAYNLLGYERYFNSFNHFMSLYEPHNLELWGLYGEGKITKAELNSDRYSYPLRMVGIENQELADTFCREVLGRIPTKNKVIPGAVELLEYLYPKYNLYILSNGFKELQEHKMQTAGLRKYFKKIVLSDDIGINKPNPELFIHALQVANSTTEESIMIGDMFDTDITGAAGVGMDQIFYNRKGLELLPFEPTYTVRNLLQIKEIL
ncbi:MAG: YjjG family noncanonical pyrimidine nucleotidase [Bacteroidaceae bacterium]|nr:YjjG family noncanonical pyrimidine nucleotidase [Bacteroidaceae bacterium]